ncbi:hypothetical protein [Kitasatospora griseola]|uniref:hypothetical protein n=1 Tax=Kitasatospora griseola TaxID=2064 RepID=UPI003801DCFF
MAVPEPVKDGNLPPTDRQTTASACLIDQLPEDESWFATAEEARAACAPLPIPAAARLYALLIPADHAAAWANDRNDTKPVTWAPARLIEWDTPLEGLPAPTVDARNVPTSPSRLRSFFRRSTEPGTAGPP